MAAALIGKTDVGVKEFGRDVEVAENPTAKLMYYLDSICYVLNIEKTESNIRKLRDYKNYRRLSNDEVDQLILLCVLFSPDVLLGKCIFPDEEMCGMDMNKFYELSAVSHRFLVTEEIVVGGQTRRVQKILFFRDIWLECFYLEPIKQYQSKIEGIAASLREGRVARQRPQPRAIAATPSRTTQTPVRPQRQQSASRPSASQPAKKDDSSCVII
ncbi:uncharacterized protein LOC134276158 [Saccostrea cucullata]|uniref:uncharacterized protein LOC134276158 n=1 Tax=Saccostrea cuccullata TaxID=36930 RepID=UPI002ED5243B